MFYTLPVGAVKRVEEANEKERPADRVLMYDSETLAEDLLQDAADKWKDGKTKDGRCRTGELNPTIEFDGRILNRDYVDALADFSNAVDGKCKPGLKKIVKELLSERGAEI